MQRSISFTLNGKPIKIDVDDGRMLLWVLRYDLGLPGTKFGCGENFCGACSVIVDQKAAHSCSVPMSEVASKEVLTIEGLTHDGKLHPLQEAFLAHDGFQCGFCTPGMIVTAYSLLLQTKSPTREQIVEHMESNLCRCGAHVRIIAAIEQSAKAMAGGAR